MELTKNQYKEALLQEGILKGRNLELLSAIYESPSCEITGTELAEIFGYKAFPPINALLGKLGKRIAQFHNVLPEDIGTDHQWWCQIVTNGKRDDEGFKWSLQNNLFDALVELGLLQDLEIGVFPEIVPQGITEGAKKTTTVNTYERSTVARAQCIQHYGTACSVCDMDFMSIYGDIGDGFIHVHHLVDLSTIAAEYKVNPIRDLRPMCPNCHAMLHKTKPAMSISDLKLIFKQQKAA